MGEVNIADVRREYARETLDEKSVLHSPFEQFSLWLDEAVAANVPEPTAMTLSTVNDVGQPSARVVLLKGLDHGMVFYTNYESRKGTDLLANPKAAILFFWPELERQVRAEGVVEKVSRTESEEYFRSRPYASKIGAWASAQSSPVPSRMELEGKYKIIEKLYPENDVPLPPHWGGYRLLPTVFEFWQGRPNRLHDRIRYTAHAQGWKIERLCP